MFGCRLNSRMAFQKQLLSPLAKIAASDKLVVKQKSQPRPCYSTKILGTFYGKWCDHFKMFGTLNIFENTKHMLMSLLQLVIRNIRRIHFN